MPPPIHRLYGFGITEIQNSGVPITGQPRTINFVSGGATADPGDPTIINVITGGGGGFDTVQTDQFIATAAQTVFVLSLTPAAGADVLMFINGQEQTNGADFTVVGTTVTWINPLVMEAGWDVTFQYHF